MEKRILKLKTTGRTFSNLPRSILKTDNVWVWG